MDSSGNLIHMPNLWTRRKIIGSLALAFAAPGAFAEQLTLTPRQTEGPFYPDHLPLDTDNDLLIVNDGIIEIVADNDIIHEVIIRPGDIVPIDSVEDDIKGMLFDGF